MCYTRTTAIRPDSGPPAPGAGPGRSPADGETGLGEDDLLGAMLQGGNVESETPATPEAGSPPPAVRENRLCAWARPLIIPPAAAAGGHELHRERGGPGGPHRAGRPTTSRASPRD